jgi:REP element-mobilizing transposase RayT
MDVERYRRRSIRLDDYDYTQSGAYFVTICTHDRKCLFGSVVDDDMLLNAWGGVQACWATIPGHYPAVELDALVIMPNHLCGIIVIGDDGRSMIHHAPKREFGKPIPQSLAGIVGTFKAAVTRHIRRLPDAPEHPVWQRNYYEYIIRDAASLDAIRAHILHNPAKWSEDSLYVGK